ncbi:MAG: hypothetical protein FJZ47_02890 [Candidatus Tectomicrobia bacterium]|uniref:Uncharacterized protein n=1 Tax=Tectimicrobiota bacterium TaxID=2528274 RepID=A0A937VXI3_UNCTE|nr:hypothetical protein [Candidatus Tectomicrobia bacterium]
MLATGSLAALVLIGALASTGMAVYDPLLDFFGHDRQTKILVLTGLGSAAVFGPLLAASLPVLQRQRPAFAALYARLGWGLYVVAASIGVHVWYGSIDSNDVQNAWVGARVVGVGLALALWRVQGLSTRVDTRWLLPARLLLSLPAGLIGLGCLLPHAPLELLGALGFVTVWALVAWCGYRAHAMHLVNLATAVLAVRVFVAYIEIFGSLLATGVGLIASGFVLLALTWFWVRKIRLQPGGAA